MKKKKLYKLEVILNDLTLSRTDLRTSRLKIGYMMITDQLLSKDQSKFFLIDHHHMLYMGFKFGACCSYFYLFEPKVTDDKPSEPIPIPIGCIFHLF